MNLYRQPRAFQFHAVLSIGLFVILGTSGCDNGPKLGEVTGIVTLDGKPLPNATVAFTPEDGQMSTGSTEDDGRFVLKFADGRPGAMLGESTVSVETYRYRPNEAGEFIEYPELVPLKYNQESILKQNVEPGKQEVKFDLSTKD